MQKSNASNKSLRLNLNVSCHLHLWERTLKLVTFLNLQAAWECRAPVIRRKVLRQPETHWGSFCCPSCVQLQYLLFMTLDLKHIVRAQDSGARLARCFKSEVLRRYQNYQSFMTVQTFAIFSHLLFSFPLSLPLSTTAATYHFVCLHSACAEECSTDLMTFAESQN